MIIPFESTRKEKKTHELYFDKLLSVDLYDINYRYDISQYYGSLS